ncbi:hypothetical protein D918_03008 [Trichuris suis]|nr:hypothetical protein D918_03008 [Trichuris suis]
MKRSPHLLLATSEMNVVYVLNDSQPLLSEAHDSAIRRTWKTELPVRAKIVLEAKGEPLLLQLMLPDLSEQMSRHVRNR